MNPEATIDVVKAAAMSQREFERQLLRDSKMSRSLVSALMRDGFKGILEIAAIGERAVNSIRTTLGEMRETGRLAIERLQVGMHQRFQLLLDWAGEIPGRMIGAISSLAADMLTAGRNAMQSLWDGAVEKFESFIEWVRGIPSRIADEIGAINLFETVSSGFGGLFGAESEEEPPTLAAPTENAGASPEVAAATSVLEAVRASGQLPAERMAELAAEAEHYRSEIAELQAQLDQLIDTPIMDGRRVQAETELGLIRRDLASVEADMESAQAQESELRAALNLLSDTEVSPEIDMTSIDRALSRVQALSSALNGLPTSSVAGVSTPTVDGARASGGPVRAGGTYLVGERGAELITPTRSGFVHTARDTTRMMRRIRSGFLPANANGDEVFHGLASAISEAAGLASPRETAAASPRGNLETAKAPAINLTLSGPIVQGLSIANGWDPERVAREVAQRIEQALAQTMRGLHADFV